MLSNFPSIYHTFLNLVTSLYIANLCERTCIQERIPHPCTYICCLSAHLHELTVSISNLPCSNRPHFPHSLYVHVFLILKKGAFFISYQNHHTWCLLWFINVMGSIISSKIHMLKSEPPVLQNVTVSGYKALYYLVTLK